MFYDLLALLKECVPLSITSVAAFNVSFVQMPLSIFEGNPQGLGPFFAGQLGTITAPSAMLTHAFATLGIPKGSTFIRLTSSKRFARRNR
jgi:hypothetical protein